MLCADIVCFGDNPYLLIDLLRHRQNSAIWSPIALAIGEKTAKAVLHRVRCNNSNESHEASKFMTCPFL